MIAAGAREILVNQGIGEGGEMVGSENSSLPRRRRLAGYALAAVLAPVLAVVLAVLRGQPNLATEVLAVMVAVIAVALLGGLVPAVLEAIAGSLLNFSFTPPMHTSTIAQANDAAAVAIVIAVAVVVGLLADTAVRQAGQAAASEARAVGIPKVFARGSEIIREFADGHIEVIIPTEGHTERTYFRRLKPRILHARKK